jgi:hypothetical protein
MLGLNISASFNSAVTIYILIPLLVIPQLLLSGVVISFDKFNPKVGKPVGIPVMGEVMASRWAFEALMVTQFKDNPYEHIFYELDKTAANAEFKKVYYIPALESKLAYCLNHHSDWADEDDEKMQETITLLHDEIQRELNLVGESKLPEVDKLQIGEVDSLVFMKTGKFLNTLKNYYSIKLNNAKDEKEKLLESYASDKTKLDNLISMKQRFVNDAVMSMVENVSTADRIVEYDGDLIQKIYPIYNDEHKPKNIFDFSANLFQPTKYFLGKSFDTLYFNLMVIWSMTIFLFIALYFDFLKRLIKLLEGNRKYRKKDKH